MRCKAASVVAFAGLLFGCGGDSGSGGSKNSKTLPQLITGSLIVDVNGDGRKDVLIGNQDHVYNSDILLINNADGSFTLNTSALPPHYKGVNGSTISFAAGDFNNDGKVDIVAITVDATQATYYGSSQIQLYFGNGDGTFTDASSNISHGLWPDATLNSVAAPFSIRVADLDGDGFPDFIVVPGGSANTATQAFIFLNDGTGHFAPAPISITTGAETTTVSGLPNDMDVLIGDLNGDGRVDLLATDAGQPIVAYINQSTPGHLMFTAKISQPAQNLIQGALVDLNGDGVLDYVGTSGYSGSASATVPVQAFINDGTGNFREDETVFSSGQPSVIDTNGVYAGDLTHSGRDSIFIADTGYDQNPYPGERSWYLKNDGAGHLADATAANFGTSPAYTHGAALGDLNGDGYIDVFMNNSAQSCCTFDGQVPRFWNNDGKGNFTSYTPTIQ
jgi:hypothetical protein